MPVVTVFIESSVNGARDAFYSPSTCINEFLETGKEYAVEEFKTLMLDGLAEANRRVIKKYGFGCFGCDLEMMKVEKLADDTYGGKVIVTDMRTG